MLHATFHGSTIQAKLLIIYKSVVNSIEEKYAFHLVCRDALNIVLLVYYHSLKGTDKLSSHIKYLDGLMLFRHFVEKFDNIGKIHLAICKKILYHKEVIKYTGTK